MNPNLDRHSHVPLYFQLKTMLVSEIERGKLKPGDLVPSEFELQEKFGLSRTTVRQALSEMVFEGLLNRQRGRGTFVAISKFLHSPEDRHGLTYNLSEQGIKPGWKIIDTKWVEPPTAVQESLKVNGRERAFRIRRLRLADNEAIGFHTVYLPEAIANQINQESLNEGESLKYLAHLPQMQNSKAQRTIEAIGASDNEVKYLKMIEGEPILQIERLVTSAEGKPIEFLQARYRGDRFKYQISL
jgi:GntR family transcriptional regulator